MVAIQNGPPHADTLIIANFRNKICQELPWQVQHKYGTCNIGGAGKWTDRCGINASRRLRLIHANVLSTNARTTSHRQVLFISLSINSSNKSPRL